MARTLNVAVHTVRKEAFIDAAQRLMQAKGYEQMSVQDVLDELGASRGAFYHYFDSKQALLEADLGGLVNRRAPACFCPSHTPAPSSAPSHVRRICAAHRRA